MTVVLRIALALLALDELVVGVWNQFAPQSFYAYFPTVGTAVDGYVATSGIDWVDWEERGPDDPSARSSSA